MTFWPFSDGDTGTLGDERVHVTRSYGPFGGHRWAIWRVIDTADGITAYNEVASGWARSPERALEKGLVRLIQRRSTA